MQHTSIISIILEVFFLKSFELLKLYQCLKTVALNLTETKNRFHNSLCLLKNIKKIVYTWLDKYLIANAIVRQNQFGFRSKSSTCIALLELVNKLSQSTDGNKITVGVFIELAKAIDTTAHRFLVSTMASEQLLFHGFKAVVK